MMRLLARAVFLAARCSPTRGRRSTTCLHLPGCDCDCDRCRGYELARQEAAAGFL
jgi:pyruvate-formate lyase-activating enzyme